MNKDLEIRNITTEIRSLEENSRKISGLAIPSNSRSGLLTRNMKGRTYRFYEVISEDALNEELINGHDIKLYLNHDGSQGTYARSKNGQGSLRLFITERGLEFETELPNTVFGDALLEGVRRGDFDAISFAFIPDEQEWKDNEDGTYERTIRSIAFLDEISVLSCTPAYSETDVNIRSLEEYIEQKDKEEQEKRSQEEEEKFKETEQELDNLLKEFEELGKLD